MNSVTLIGRLGVDPQVRYTPNGTAVGNFRMATSESWRGKDGNRMERTEWHNVVVWGKLAETVGKYCTKGRQVCVVGSLRTRKWQDREGHDRYTTEINCVRIEFLDSANKNNQAKQEVKAAETPTAQAAESSVGDVPEASMPPEEQYAQEAEGLFGEGDK